MGRPKNQADERLAEYHLIADTVGGVPNLRGKDNLYQTVAILGSTTIGAGIGALTTQPFWTGAVVGAIIALVASALVSGSVLMVLGWFRAAKYKKRQNR